MFTDINSAIDDARFMKATTGHCHAVIQRPGGIMLVRKGCGKGMQALYTTKQDRFGTVNTDEQRAA